MVSVFRTRVVAVGLGAGGVLLRLVVTFLLDPVTFRMDSLGAALLTWADVMVLCLAVPMVLFGLLANGSRRRPASFEVSGTAFVVHARLYPQGMFIIGLMFCGSVFLLLTERVPYTDHLRLAEPGLTVPLALLYLGLLSGILLLDSPSLTLTPSGLTVRAVLVERQYPWASLVADGPPLPGPMAWTLLLYCRDGSEVRVPITWLHVEPAFLAAVIRFYVDDPEHRDGIGTEDALYRLRVAFDPDTEAPASRVPQAIAS